MNRMYPKNRVVFGARKRECDVCGFDYLTTELLQVPGTNLLVCQADYNEELAGVESKQVYDFLDSEGFFADGTHTADGSITAVGIMLEG